MKEFKNITVLYVDDEKMNLFLFEKSFQSRYKIITAISAFDGLKKLEEYRDDIIVVISDMRMPLMNGIDFILKAREKYKNIAYFILTGYDYNDDIRDALKNKLIYKFFTKPFDFNEIVASVENAINELGLI